MHSPDSRNQIPERQRKAASDHVKALMGRFMVDGQTRRDRLNASPLAAEVWGAPE